jgi:broad specificity phosphatase PhoE
MEQSRQAGVHLKKMILSSHATDKKSNSSSSNRDVTNLLTIQFLSSPLKRALQTVQLVIEGFSSEDHDLQSGKDHDQRNNNNMAGTTTFANNNNDTTRMQFSIPPVIVQPLATEVMMASCDIGTPVSELTREFPSMDWSLLLDSSSKKNNDYWWPHHHSVEETWNRMLLLPGDDDDDDDGTCIESSAQAQVRVHALAQYLRDAPACREANVVVLVCHGDLIWWLTRHHNDGSGEDDDATRGTKTKNGHIVNVTQRILQQHQPL